ncbi:MAG: hypothetical protein ABI091_07280 [Ferruginibacter sp.]
MKITYLLPSRQRPIAFFDTINNIIENSASDNYEIIATLDSDDESMNNSAVKASISTYPKVTAYWGKSHNKVHAINRECDNIPDDTDIVILVSDDQRYIIKGYDDLIRVEMNRNYPDKDGVLHFMDNTPARDKMITMSIMGYPYFKRFNYLYHPEYANVYVDNEFTEVAKKLGKYKLMRDFIYEHNHPVWGTAPNDDLYVRNEEPISYQKDKEIYFKHLENNFGL